jgi:hypothetical protein
MACIAATAKSLLIALDCRHDALSSSVKSHCNVELMSYDCVRAGGDEKSSTGTFGRGILGLVT